DYPADGGDGDDDDSSDDDEEEEEAEEEEEEHRAPSDSVVVPVVDHVPYSEETEPFETDESAATPPSPPACRTTARISIRPKSPILLPPEEEVERLLALPTPPPSPLISLSPPSAEERFARAAIGKLRASSPLPPPVPATLLLPSPPLLPLPSSPLPPLPYLLFIPPVDRREDIPEAELPPRKRLCLTTPTSRYEVGESSTAVPRPTGGRRIDYGFVGTLDAEARRQRAEAVSYWIRDTWVDPRETAEEVALVTLEGVNSRVTELAIVQEQDTQDIYAVIEDTQDRQTQIHQTVEALVDDRQYHYKTARLLDQEALVSREALAHFMGFSSAGHLATALREIRALQAREQARADVPEGTARAVVGLNNMPPKRTFAATKTARAAAATTAATPMTTAAIEQLVADRVSAALANHDTLRNSTNGHGDGSHNSGTGTRGATRTLRECTYKDFLNCHPLNFKGTERVVVLS
ncbi:hypothetical protein Tco_1478520, partial [Tanacetum coccineum]